MFFTFSEDTDRPYFALHSFPFPLSSHWLCPMPRHRPGALMERFFHCGYYQSLDSYVITKREYAMASCEMLLQLNLKAGSPLLQPHMLKAAWKDRDSLCIDLIIDLCTSVHSTEPNRQGGNRIHS